MSKGTSDTKKPVVVVTGFGPFGKHEVNASWVAVQKLAELGLQGNKEVQLVILELPVVYDKVKELIPQLWEKYEPALVVHVGVSGVAQELNLEQGAHNDGYLRCDINGCIPMTTKCVDECCELSIKSGINMSQVCEEVNSRGKMATVVSHDAGRYLCDFSYFQSLHINSKRAAFIHVPPLNQPYTVLQLAQGLDDCISTMLKQIL